MNKFLKLWIKNLITCIAFLMVCAAIVVIAAGIESIFRYNMYVGWTVLIGIAVTVFTILQSISE